MSDPPHTAADAADSSSLVGDLARYFALREAAALTDEAAIETFPEAQRAGLRELLHVVRRVESLATDGARENREDRQDPRIRETYATDLATSVAHAPRWTLPCVRGPYRLERLLDAGAMAEVYLARDVRHGREAAYKVPFEQFARQPAELARFRGEGTIVSRLNHPHICQVLDWGVHDGVPFLAMEFIPGISLQRRLQSGRLSPPQAVVIARQMAEALQHAHAQHIVHRDLKPANVILRPDGAAVLTDFGLWLWTALPLEMRLTRAGTVVGTLAYMSPEQAEGRLDLDHRSDIFSLGVMLYEMLAGELPFRGGYATTLTRIIASPPAPFAGLGSGVSPGLARVCLRMLEKSPADRFQSMAEVIDALDRIEHASAPGGMRAAVPLCTHSVAVPAAGRPSRRRAGAALFLLLLSLAWFSSRSGFRRDDDPPPRPAPSATAPQRPPPLAVAPLTAQEAQLAQQRWAEHLRVPVEFTNSLGMIFCLIPPGEFTQGTVVSDFEPLLAATGAPRREVIDEEAPAHRVRITRPFFCGKHEVRQRDVQALTGRQTSAFCSTGSMSRRVAGLATGDFPAESLTWFDAVEFANEASRREGLPPVYELVNIARHNARITHAELRHWARSGAGYRLLTSAEWEYGCRAGATTWFPWGNADNGRLANNRGDQPLGASPGPWLQRPATVGLYPANPFGLHDTCGSVCEWVFDTPGDYMSLSKAQPADDPVADDPVGRRVYRGGSWGNDAAACRPARWWAHPPDLVHYYLGVRLALSVEAVQQSIENRNSTNRQTLHKP